ncbi:MULTISPECIES: hypothetical protein [unclassified Rhodococcus (in: high G+C Gram-positive bacteria)]|uniref:hypothetical protein n=1 Tax=unclassified Rhodococcus (in: high G+C Gram-positive bacteria) TaxID=192944 RepID=UPI000B9AB955|nr:MULTISPECIES: hypothetical protein [unclassified Rhodococcus (in: high G+C Gram-positive bacteria)]OZE31526.1 hypothetical protein CH259_25700 [Rhodococcus sp. 05-2254-4]OZE42456.1 hypothetical protein CH261_20185 [Rhodococcus sp. 05-2254-3]OZE46612.1 hypothetical protein CH283_19850 [Rhodococcus sp. 05-2254-2]
MTEQSDGPLFDLPASAADPQGYRDAAARVAVIRERSRPAQVRRAARKAYWDALERSLTVAATTDARLSQVAVREDAPIGLLQDRVDARLTVALISWLLRRHPLVTVDDREGPPAWTAAAQGSELVGDPPSGVTDSPTDDPACLAAFDGFGLNHSQRVRRIDREYSRWVGDWIATPESELRSSVGNALRNVGAAQRAIDEWTAEQ